jgi:multicomponent Na+:H+ antiporter subunit D
MNLSLANALHVIRASFHYSPAADGHVRIAPNTLVYWFGGWGPRQGIALGISFAIDPIGAGLAALAGLLVLAGLLFSSKYFDTIGNLYHVLMLVFLAAMCGFALTGDLFNLFVFFELMSAAAYGLCGYKTEDPAPVQGAFNFAVTNTVGAYFVLTGIGLVYARTGALNMAQIGRALAHGPKDALVVAAFTLIACGFLVKAAVVPFHFWLADAHAVAPAPVCILFSGVMVELGLYAVTRVYWSVFSGVLATSAPALRAIFATFGVITAVAGAAMCFSQHNLKRLLAFSTISHMGVMLIGFGLLNPDGLAGTALYVLGHAGAKGGLFLCAGIVLHRCQSVDETELKLKLAPMPFTAAVFLCGAAALAGTPLSGIAAGAASWPEPTRGGDRMNRRILPRVKLRIAPRLKKATTTLQR